ncbi:MAG: hypothetical protein K2P76_02550 [Lachnospiraceae bacterium]|nr:hypothetical protein [Lachnospiraceae bacterium]MDE6982678.1 hypothetical protein [Lachnospiraceae bacterium]
MSVQDKLERTLRDIHVMISRGREVPGYEEYVLLYKKDMIKLLDILKEAVNEMMDEYEITEQSRAKGDREAERRREETVRNANRQAEDIYAASVLYTDDALGRIQDIIETAENSMKEIMETFGKDLEKQKKKVKSNQRELKSQLEDLKDTSKYIKIIEERNKEIAREKAIIEGRDKPERYQRRKKQEPEFVPLAAEIKVNEEYFKRAGLSPEGIPVPVDEPVYEKPEIKINEDYFRRAGIPLEGEETANVPADIGQARVIEKKQTIAEALAEVRGEKLTKEQDEAIDAEMEAILKESLDAEYFQWVGKEEPEEKQEKKGLARFLKNT